MPATISESEQLGLSYQRLAPGARQPFSHRHAHDEELYVVLSGTGWVQLEGEAVALLPMDALRVAPSTVRVVRRRADRAWSCSRSARSARATRRRSRSNGTIRCPSEPARG